MDRLQAQQLATTLPALEPEQAFRRGIELLNADYPELLLPVVAKLSSSHTGSAKLAQLLGLAARAAGDGPLAWRSFCHAFRMAPNDPLIAHSHARTALEAGHPAVDLFEAARRHSPQDGGILTGLAAALVAEGRAQDADAMLMNILDHNPRWTDGHRALGQIRGQFGGSITGSVEQALRLAPQEPQLHALTINLLLQARHLEAGFQACVDAKAQIGNHGWLAMLAGHAASEMGDHTTADRAFAEAGEPTTVEDASLLLRHATRNARLEEATELLDTWLPRDKAQVLVPYASIVWRLTADRRADWLEGDKSLVGVYDLAEDIEDLNGLADRLRALHRATNPPIDQSVRGGTQTDGNLFLRDDPLLQHVRALVLEKVAVHAATLGPQVSGHPTLIAHRTPLRISGSWSVRLQDAGFHADHVHTQGWLSSALYVALPDMIGADGGREQHAGWLSLGESRDLAPDLDPYRLVEPKPGRLVLFPSTLWHGTRPFPAGERLTIAFDVARPKQD